MLYECISGRSERQNSISALLKQWISPLNKASLVLDTPTGVEPVMIDLDIVPADICALLCVDVMVRE